MTARTPSRRHEAPAIGGMARRVLRSLARRAGEGEVEALQELIGLQAALQDAITEAGRGLHEAGFSYTYIASETGVSRQAARQRFAPKPAPADPAAGLATLLDEVGA